MRLKKRSIVRTMGVVVLGFCFLVGTMGSIAAQEKVTLTWWKEGVIYPWEEHIYDMVREKFPHIRFNIQPFIGELAYGEYATKIAIALASGKGPDVFDFFDPHVYWMVSSGMVAPAPDDIKEHIKKEAVNEGVYEVGLGHDGKMYGVPWIGTDYDWYTTYYNKNMFEEAGITTPPRNWEEFIDAARKLTKYDPSGKIIRSGFSMRVSRARAGIYHKWIPFFTAAGGRRFSEEMTRTLFDSEAGIEALQLYVDMLYKYKIDAVDIPRDYHAFAEEKTAMFQRGMWVIEWLKDNAPELKPGEDYGVFLIPNHKAEGKTILHIDAQFVSGVSKNKNEAWDVIRYLISPEVTLKSAKERNYLPPFKTAAQDPFFKQNELLQVFASQPVIPTPKLRSIFELQETIGKYIESVCFRKMEVKEALKEADVKATEILREEMEKRE